MLSVLRGRDFALLWTGGLVSVLGDWVLNAALPFFVYEETGSTVATAGMIVARLAPAVALGTVAGVFVDRWDRKRVLVLANLIQPGAVPLGVLGLRAVVIVDCATFVVAAVLIAAIAAPGRPQPATAAGESGTEAAR